MLLYIQWVCAFVAIRYSPFLIVDAVSVIVEVNCNGIEGSLLNGGLNFLFLLSFLLNDSDFLLFNLFELCLVHFIFLCIFNLVNSDSMIIIQKVLILISVDFVEFFIGNWSLHLTSSGFFDILKTIESCGDIFVIFIV